MAMDFSCTGAQNDQSVFRDNMSRTVFHLGRAYQAGVTPELLEGDEVAIPNSSSSWSSGLLDPRAARSRPQASLSWKLPDE